MDKYRWPTVQWPDGRGEFDFTDQYEGIRDALPSRPGIYLWMVYRSKDDPPSQQFIYVGETTNLHRGLRKFFSTGDTHRTLSAHTKCCQFFRKQQSKGYKVSLRLLELECIEYGGAKYTTEHLNSTEHRQFIKTLLADRACAKGYQLLFSDSPEALTPPDPALPDKTPGDIPIFEEDERTAKIYIYALLDPVTGKVYYVGQSERPHRRYWKHVSSRDRQNHAVYTWIHYLNRTYSRYPTLAIVDKVPPFAEPRRCETWWICKFIELGHPLLNANSTHWNEAEWGSWEHAKCMKGSYDKPSQECDEMVYAALKGAKAPRK